MPKNAMTLCCSGRGSRFPLPYAFRLKAFLRHGKLANLAACKLDLSGLHAAFHDDKSGPHLSAGRILFARAFTTSASCTRLMVQDRKIGIPEGLFESPSEVARTQHHVANSKRERLPQDYVLGRSE